MKRGILGLTVGAVAVLALMPCAFAAPDTTRFDQVSSWAVSKVDPKDNTPTYCTMAARYDNNAVLTLARNTRAESTLAFDFQRAVFIKDESYFLTLRIGNLSRSINIKPASNSAIVLRMGQEEGLDTALEEAGFVELNVNGGLYRFEVSDYKSAQRQLALCLGADDATQAPSKPAMPVAAPAPAAPVLKTRDVAEVKAVPPVVETAPAALPPIAAPVTASTVRIKPGTNSAELEAQLRAALAERDAYRTLLQDTSKKKSDEARAARPQDQVELGKALKDLDALQAERADLIRKLERAKSDAALAKAVTAPASVPENAPAPAAAVDTAEIEKAQKALALMQAQNAELKKQVEQTQQDIIEARTKQAAVKPIVAAVPANADTAKLEKLKADIASLEKQNTQLMRDAEDAAAKARAAAEAKKRLDAIEAENQRLAQQLNAAKLKEPAPEAVVEKLVPVQDKAAEERFKAAEAENQRLAKELNEAKAVAAQKTVPAVAVPLPAPTPTPAPQVADARFKAAEAENQRLAQELNRARENLKQASTQAASQREQALATQIEASKVQAATETETRLQSRFEQAERENQRLANQLASMRAAQAIKDQAAMPKSPTENLVQSMGVAAAPVEPTPTPVQRSLPVQPPVVEVASLAQPKIPSTETVVKKATAVASVSGPDASIVKTVLQKAAVSLKQPIERVAGASSASMTALRWDTGEVYGNAQVEQMQGSFLDKVRAYLRKTQGRCGGTFDESLSNVSRIKTHAYATADVACAMNDGTGSGASIVFFENGSHFVVVAHETDLNSLPKAMDVRDKVAAALPSSL